MQIIVVKLLTRGVVKITALKELRQRKGMTQADLARIVGVTQSLVAQWERGASMPSAAKLPEIAKALDCTIDELFARAGAGQNSA